MDNNLTTKNFFTTKRLNEEIITKTFTKTGVNPYIQQYKNLYIINKIIADKSLHKGDYVGCKLNTKNLTILFGNRHAQTCAIIKDLIRWGLIHKTANAVIGSDAARYALTEQYSADGILILPVDISDAAFIQKLIDFDKIENNKVLKQLKDNNQLLTLNDFGRSYLSNKYNISIISFIHDMLHTIDGAVKEKSSFKALKTTIVKENKERFLLGGVEIEFIDLPLIQILIGDFNTSRPDEKSRVYNNLTSLKRELRPYIDFNGKSMMMTDISNSQVLLSVSPVMKEYVMKSGLGYGILPDDIQLYKSLTEEGLFYEYLIKKLEYTGDRKKFKTDFFKDVFFSKVTKAWTTPIKDAFIQEFPTVYKIINQLKAKNYGDFAISMQRLEASIMIDTVAKKMIKEKRVILTLHDAIVCTNEADLERAEELISDAMMKYKLVPKFKRESSEMILSNMDDIHVEIISGSETPIIKVDETLIQHSFGEVLIQNYNDFKTATATLTSDDMRTLINRFAVSAMGYNSVAINNVIYSFIVKYEDIEGKEDEMKVIVFKEKVIRKLVA